MAGWYDIVLTGETLQGYRSVGNMELLAQRLNYLKLEGAILEFRVFFDSGVPAQHIQFERAIAVPLALIENHLAGLPHAVAITDHA